MLNNPDLHLTSLGSMETANSILQKMLAGSKAYSNLVSKNNITWNNLPILTKENFYGLHDWQDIIPEETYANIYAIDRSSGSSSKDGGFFWPECKTHNLDDLHKHQQIAIQTFKLKERKTLVIIGFSLGSWSGGMTFAFFFRLMALQEDISLVVYTPGNEYEEIVEIIAKMQHRFDQILILLCPSAIFYLDYFARKKHIPLPHEKITLFLGGEPYSEETRMHYTRQLSANNGLPMISYYASADTGLLGMESPALIKVRQLLCQHPDIAKQCGFNPQHIPNLYHAAMDETYLEEINNQLIITRWQGLPLIRYNLKDNVKLLSWKNLCLTIANIREDDKQTWLEFSKLPLTDIIAISGRSDDCIFICGTNIYNHMLRKALMQSSLQERITGVFAVWSSSINSRNVLNWQIELKEDQATPDNDQLKIIHQELVNSLGEQQPEFALDYKKLYQPLEQDDLMLFQFHFCESPYLLNHPQLKNIIKRKLFIDNGPL